MARTELQIAPEWLKGPAARATATALEEHGYVALFVGGCVRNTLLGEPVSDLDLATDALPSDVMRIAEAAGIRAIPTGLDHGTVTLVHEETPVEVTTFRSDTETDGRHAVVRFSREVAEDAARRDFTMNALYCDARGWIHDPLGGLLDVEQRRLRFVGVASERVQEDYLRILRFFRFYAWYADPEFGMDKQGLQACADGADGLSQISAERIGYEMRKLLSAPYSSFAIAAMEESGVLKQVLPNSDVQALNRFEALYPGPDAICRLAALGGEDPEERFRLTRAERKRLAMLRAEVRTDAGAAELAWRHGIAEGEVICILRAALLRQALPANLTAEIERGAAAIFPVKASDLGASYSGALIGERLRALETAWIASDFTLDRHSLLALPS